MGRLRSTDRVCDAETMNYRDMTDQQRWTLAVELNRRIHARRAEQDRPLTNDDTLAMAQELLDEHA